MVLEEANQIAKALELPENLPIATTNIVEYHVPPFGFAYAYKIAGNIATRNYVYYVSRDNKFNQLDIANYDQTCLRLASRGPTSIVNFDP